MREFSVPASFTIGDYDSVVAPVYSLERDDPNHVAIQRLVNGTWTDVTSAQVAAQVRATALGLMAKGVKAGDRVALLSATRYEWPIIDFAILSIGAVTVPIYETSAADQIRHVLADSGAVLAIAESAGHAAKIESVRAEVPTLGEALVIDDGALDQLAAAGASVDPAELEARVAAIKSSDPATLIYTSGTTGRPKGCQLTHANLLSELRGVKACFPDLLAKGQKLLVFLPLAHVLARAVAVAGFSNQVTLGFTSDIKNLVPILGVFKPTLVVSVPRVFEKVYNTAEQNARNDGKGKIFQIAADTAIEWSKAQDENGSAGASLWLNLKHTVFDKLVYGKLKAALGGNCVGAISGGAPLGARLGHFYRGVGVTIYEGYGLTETSAAITVNRIGELRVGSVGRLVPGNSMRIADDGELLLSGGVVYGGYWNNPTATDEAFTDGWFHTGDLGAIDDDGYLSIVGRKKEIIVTAGGKNVAPAPLEDVMRAHPLISQAMCVGDQEPFIAALITIDPEAFDGWKQRNNKDAGASVGDLAEDPALIAEIQKAVDDANQTVSKAEAIRKFRILPVDFTEDTGELTPTLKVKRKVVAEKFAAEIAALYS
ncbi:long-chain fatty acid--CoA ligase [Mycobacterium sp. CBMA293]|uniref:AMP-dependent synthetase/ligase n=1 Tax=unclassified Mycolicibacterium TaxID=2636767 RepID=UPI001327D63E|nr:MULTISPECIES: long-chain fatty acid--CoA ligase [unclassified Mycolicibacterium]MUL45506.1 long-chain fatty acid--CoA ligase [Mycolicibacterium sp. CBMA 360]MUL96062.1 long-chain fatty acid--CoA ligase [Mycolicibacterium sp. CBMA 230]MUL60176.1 long-chain fatty acid--CoA ligase [Mycolicibacterium sp. CBMA 335]MUL72963.1 long-chain fatty acid--CoA ligase [Mycolicibacterium sp. CBMA 311]MUM08077.1 long-chain fatty acid--CoA ligase [Mycolicibacterium sp. CBMA 213]